MAYNGSGTFVPLTAPTYPAVDGEVITAAYYNAVIADLISGLNKAMCRDGQSTATANLPMGGFTLAGLRAAVASGEAVEYAQLLALLANLNVSTSANLPANTNIGTVLAAEILALDGISGNIEANFAKLLSPAFTGTPTAPTAAPGTNTTQLATMAALYATAMNANLPGQSAGTVGKSLISGLVTVGQADWGNVPLNGDAAVVSSGVNVTLTAASKRLQAISMTATGLTVALPDATTMTLLMGSPAFVVVNTGLYSFRVVDNAGNTIATVGSGQSMAGSLYDSSTAAGGWAAHNASKDGSPLPRSYLGTASTVAAGTLALANNSVAIVALGPDKFLYAYSDNTAGLGKVVCVDLTGTVPSYGASLTYFAGGGTTALSMTAMSSTQALLCYNNGTVSEAKVISVSGTTCTAGAAHSFAGVAVNYTTVDRVSATTAMVTYNTTSTNNYIVKLLTISGTTVSSGSAGTIRAATATDSRAATVFSATRGGILYTLFGTPLELRSATIDLSVNPPTINGDAVFNSATPTQTTLTALPGANNGIATYLSAGVVQAVPVNYGASTVVQGVPVAIGNPGVGASYYSKSFLFDGRSVVYSSLFPTTALNCVMTKLSLASAATVNAYSQVTATPLEILVSAGSIGNLIGAASTRGKILWGYGFGSGAYALAQEYLG